MLHRSLECDEIEYVSSHDGLDIYRAKKNIYEFVHPNEKGNPGPLWYKEGTYFTYDGKPERDTLTGHPYFNLSRRYVGKAIEHMYATYIQLAIIDEKVFQDMDVVRRALEQQYYEEVL